MNLFLFHLQIDIDNFRSSLINCEGCKIRLLIWHASGKGRLNTIIRSYSRKAQGILLVYDITNKWSFNSIERWYDELETVCIIYSSFGFFVNAQVLIILFFLIEFTRNT